MLILIALAGAGLYVFSLWAWPMRPCGRCSGKGTNRGSNRRRFGTCRKCKGSRTVQRIGSRQVHRAVRGASTWRQDRDGN